MADGWQKNTASRSKSANGPDRDELIVRVAGRQKGLIRTDQLRQIGFSNNGIQHRVNCRRLFRPGITVHRRQIDPRDVSSRHGIPTTSVARTILDCAHTLGETGTEDLIMAADSVRLLNRHRLEQLALEHRGRPGVPHILSLIAETPHELRSKNERRMFSICRQYGITLPLTNHRIDVSPTRHFIADFLRPDLRLIVEADSWRWHGDWQKTAPRAPESAHDSIVATGSVP